MESRRRRLRCRASCANPGSAIKKTLLATERASYDDDKARNNWVHRRQRIKRDKPHRRVYIDETATSTKLTRLRGRELKGERLRGAATYGHWHAQTYIAALRCNGSTATWLIDGALDREVYHLYIETQLAPTLQAGDIVMLDNLKVHASAKAAAVIEIEKFARTLRPAQAIFSIITPASARGLPSAF